MSLRGTLGDFSFPDIIQLVGHQQKTGVLLVKDADLEVKITFSQGNIVRAQESARESRDLLGALMVRGGAITETQLNQALQEQARTLRRLGDVLVDIGAADRDTVRHFAQLQTTETIYRLFTWRSGTYEFTAGPIDLDPTMGEMVRTEAILMEGFRIVDEWPSVRRLIPAMEVTFNVLPRDASGVSGMEQLALGLVTPGRTAQTIVDLSQRGTFETMKALAALVQGGHLRVVLPPSQERKTTGDALRQTVRAIGPIATRLALYAVAAGAIGVMVRFSSTREEGLLSSRANFMMKADTVRVHAAAHTRVRLVTALETYRLMYGSFPENLQALVAADLIDDDALHFPYTSSFLYERKDGSYVLALPLR